MSCGHGALGLLLLLPERQQSLRCRTADYAGDADRDLPQRSRRDATERDRADTDLSPEAEVAAAIGALDLEFIHGGERILTQGCNLHRVRRLDHFGERRFDRRRLPGKLAAEIFA